MLSDLGLLTIYMWEGEWFVNYAIGSLHKRVHNNDSTMSSRNLPQAPLKMMLLSWHARSCISLLFSLFDIHMMLRRLTLQGVSRVSHLRMEPWIKYNWHCHEQRSFVSTSRTVRISPKTSAKKDDGIKKEDITAATKVDTATMTAAKELVDNNVGPFPASDSFDQPFQEASSAQDWSRSFHGLSTQPFSREIANVLQEPIAPDDVEITPGMD